MRSDVEDEDPTCPCKEKLTNTLMLECDECETFWHTTCCGLTGLTQAPINKLIANKWKCPRCFKFPEGITETPESEAITNLDQNTVKSIISLVNTTVMKSLKTLLSPEDSTSDENSDTEEPSDGAAVDEKNYTEVKRRRRKRKQEKEQERQQEGLQKALEEQREEEILIAKKKDNLIIYGMPEAVTDDKKEEMLEDFTRVKKIYEGKVNVDQGDLTQLTRLGTKEANKRPRPILITLANQNKRKELLTKNMDLKLTANNESIPIYVSTDRTKKQREEFNKVRAELKERKKTDPNLTIRNNKIVPFRQVAQEAHTWAQLLAD